ncbi:hypothetical protein TREMEDRAFT_34460 [Tremella mesenterica DSM 1558]|uniref:uncharacterized protein n=1 Tax=Tremella mesenterica (strain ATCC 24925 / CBS 8224 / DSM 1558 / NBRC 9311 / NRRL Y-6157 / RJB 2259-6 / UBC 559-6) TaxID=578456 RepID=UPI00032C3DB9|nr:uncharacterized protein TREMEDRAFT_34460 [Tremella mesenterica DSM 1558]EIW66824.1 hypothetical protein TREMEDRAFT_34460 [Tremella mesenterica DSM 1558]
MAAVESSPPAAKRFRADSPTGSPRKVNGYLNGSTLSTPPPPGTSVSAGDPDSDNETESLVKFEDEDVGRRDMYLDTIARQNLDFDFERLCSKSLSNINVYACLVCGKYFQGRGRGSWAYRHAVGDNHRVWLNLSTEKFYVLPEGYLVSDPSLNDIIHVLNPKYKSSDLAALSKLPSPCFTLNSTLYLPGYIGLNNIKHNDYLNVILHLLLHVPPVRNFLLDPATPALKEDRRPTELVQRLSTLCKRLWNPQLFKAQISPHEFLQEVAKRSAGKFKMTEQGDPVEFLGWLVNTLHRDLGGTKKRNSSVIYSTFQGKVQIETQQVITHKEYARPVFDIGRDIQTVSSPFLFLALDLPPTPLFTDLNEKKIIPQVPLSTILAKFDGKMTQEFGPTLKRHHLTALPPYLILHIKRFTKNNFVEEKNPTIVNFPLRGVELNDYVDPKPSDPLHSVYDLLSNVTLDSTVASTSSTGTGPGVSKRDPSEEGQTTWKIHVRAGQGGGDEEKWFEMQDLRVEEVRREMVFLGETVIQVWERRDLSTPRG